MLFCAVVVADNNVDADNIIVDISSVGSVVADVAVVTANITVFDVVVVLLLLLLCCCLLLLPLF